MNYSSVLNKRNKHLLLLFFSKKYPNFLLPPLLLSEPSLLKHTQKLSHTHKHTHTHTHTHTPLNDFSFFLRKIRKMRFKFLNEVGKQWLFFPYTLICIVLSQYSCRFFMNLHHLNQISK